MTSTRMLRVNELLKRELGVLLERELLDQFNALVTVTRVDTAPDLRQATVYVSVFGNDAQEQQALRRLQKGRSLLQREIGRRVELKYTPVLRFKIDRTMADADRILTILDELDLTEESDLEDPPAPPVE